MILEKMTDNQEDSAIENWFNEAERIVLLSALDDITIQDMDNLFEQIRVLQRQWSDLLIQCQNESNRKILFYGGNAKIWTILRQLKFMNECHQKRAKSLQQKGDTSGIDWSCLVVGIFLIVIATTFHLTSLWLSRSIWNLYQFENCRNVDPNKRNFHHQFKCAHFDQV